MSDFELNIRNSFSKYFPEITNKGCAFHMNKAIFSKVTKSAQCIRYLLEWSNIKVYGYDKLKRNKH